jgi:hypothetical protein
LSNRIVFRLLRILAVTLILCLALAIPGAASASGTAVVRVSGPASAVQPGEQFTVSIAVEPNNAIAGMQFNLSFAPGVASAVGIQEGNLLTQNGASTYFGTGQINNQTGTISGVFGAITSPGQTVAAAGTFATITMTAGSGTGTCPFTLSNVVIGDLAGQQVQVTVVNQTVSIGDGGSQTPAPGGGGGGGGGGSNGVTRLRDYMTSDGEIVESVTAADVDLRVKLVIPAGTFVLNQYGQAPSSLTIISNIDSPPANPDTAVVSSAYSIQPGGTTFSPQATLVFSYAGLALPAGISENSLFIGLLDPATQTWIDLGGTADPVTQTVSTDIQHLSYYTLMAHTRPASFEVSGLALTPGDIEPGESVTVSFTVKNGGDFSGTYEAGLDLDDATAATKSVTLAGGASETVTFTIAAGDPGVHRVSIGDASATFLVKAPPSPGTFTVSGLTVDPVLPEPGQVINISVVVANSAGLAGTYQAVLEIDGLAVAAKEITLGSSESQTVIFTFTADAAGMHQVSIGGLVAPFEVMAPAPPPAAVVPLGIQSFSATPGYDESTGRLVSARIDYVLTRAWDTSQNFRLMLTVFHDGQLLEQVLLLPQSDASAGELTYVPSTGWESGEYAFRTELYEGESLIQDSPWQALSVTPEAAAAVVSWKTLGIIIGSALVMGSIIVALVLYYRRDTMRDYWR